MTLIFDADTHYYEPRDAFTRHIDPKFRDRAVRPIRSEQYGDVMCVGDAVMPFVTSFDSAVVPGNLRNVLQNISSGTLEGFMDERALTPMLPEYTDRYARLAKMDEQGIDACLVLPTLAVTVEHYMRDDPELTAANVRAFNRWLEDDWGYCYKDRIFAVPLMSLLDLEFAVEELERVLDLGARVIHLRPGPQGRRSPADPYFDPFWARVAEAGVTVACHSSESGYNAILAPYWSENPDPGFHGMSAFQWTNFFGDRPIMDTLSAMILHNLFGRFPTLRVATIENGSVWVSYLLKVMDKMKGMGRSGPSLGGKVRGRPSDIFREHVFVAPFHEEDVAGLAALIGSERVLFGSDWPHAEGLAAPLDFVHQLQGLPETSVEQIMGGNARELLRL
jgi:predicted TIM-barrel fold metal-dependent hydrolase